MPDFYWPVGYLVGLFCCWYRDKRRSHRPRPVDRKSSHQYS
ncbi:hypothetical protein PN466_20910 [Roseofilum reptotaenium CS-1145]|nr:hypothetical protein [Roseofilum reptotaenium]MDB9519408.1 hypothetical protein [Roseofilum reptotaenium CS-1145]